MQYLSQLPQTISLSSLNSPNNPNNPNNPGKWHRGILSESKDYPITGETLLYAPNYVKPYHGIGSPNNPTNNSPDDHMTTLIILCLCVRRGI